MMEKFKLGLHTMRAKKHGTLVVKRYSTPYLFIILWQYIFVYLLLELFVYLFILFWF